MRTRTAVLWITLGLLGGITVYAATPAGADVGDVGDVQTAGANGATTSGPGAKSESSAAPATSVGGAGSGDAGVATETGPEPGDARGPEANALVAEALDPALVAALAGVSFDPPPEELARNTHYVVSNEWALQSFHGAVQNLGGVYIGVGTDQNYMLMGWGRPELGVMLDFDQYVVDVHALYRLAFLHAETPEAFVALWRKKNMKTFYRLLKEGVSDRPTRRRYGTVLRYARRAIAHRLKRVLEKNRDGDPPIFLTDQRQYDYLVAMQKSGRVVALRGDLTGRLAIRELGAVLTEHHQVVRALYLSNAEEYFRYTRRFRHNIDALPTDGASLLLRTRAKRKDYNYVLQSYDNFRYWLSQPGIRTVRALAPRRALRKSELLFHVPQQPPCPKRRKGRRNRCPQKSASLR